MADVLGISKRLSYLRRISAKKTAIYAVIPLLYIYLPLYVSLKFSSHPVLTMVLFYALNIGILFFLVKNSLQANFRLRGEREDIEGRLNIQRARNDAILRQNASLEENIKRYSSLKKVIEEITQELDPEAVCDSLCSLAFSLVASGRGTCILYLADKEAQCLKLSKTKKEDAKLIIKTKQGDIFDHWVMRHVSPLHIADIANDFRFDFERIRHPDARPLRSLVSSPLISGSAFLGVLRLEHPDPGFYDLDDLRFLRSICDLGGIALENAQLYRSTQELAIHDGLTSVYTKGYLLELLQMESLRCLRGRTRCGLLMIDIDHFKQYNDTYGHSAGDIVLKAVAARISSMFRSRSAIVGRFGGEEFCAILPGADRRPSVEAAQLLREAISRETYILRRKATSVTVSVGVAVFPDDSDDGMGALMKADKALYEAKQKGRNRVVSA